MRYRNKTKSMKVVSRLMVGITTSLFVLTFSNALNAEGFTSYKGRFGSAKPVSCGAELENGRFKLTENLTCTEDPAIKITGSAKLNLKGYTLSGDGNNDCIRIEGNGARVRNGTVTQCDNGIRLEGDRNKIISVEVSDCANRGIRIDGDENRLSKCLVSHSGSQGIRIRGGENKIISVEVSDCADRCIRIDGDDNLILKCMVSHSGTQGIIIKGGERNQISSNLVFANCRDGIEIDQGNYNLVFYNHVEDNGNKDTCDAQTPPELYKPWFYAGIDVLAGSQNNEIKHNYACGNRGCNGEECIPGERNLWDENVEDGNCVSTNEWENNTVCPECSPNPDA